MTLAPSGRFGGCASSSLTDMCGSAHTSRPRPTSTSSGAESVSSHLIDSAPRSTTHRFSPQNRRKPITSPVPPRAFQAGKIEPRKRWIASPPNSVWMPNQPHATTARIRHGTLEPMMPNEARSSTGKGMP
ncbi:Uncharacterised protein [Klebsiella pneumoniae]|nr:Uncharacterised protein [Klebsiella pneumoniae]